MTQTTDILIAGGGLGGISLALLLAAHTDYTVTVVEAHNLPEPSDEPFTPSFDARKIALSQGSLAVYESVGLLDELLANSADITTVDVSTKGYFGRTQIRADEEGVPRLGATIESRRLGRLLLTAAHQADAITLLSPRKITAAKRLEAGYAVTLDDDSQYQCRLLVAADGARSTTRDLLGISVHHHDTGEAALVLNATTNQPHNGIAYERFLDTGPLAFLPMSDERMAVVWTGAKALIDELAALSGDDFMARLAPEAELLHLSLSTPGKRAQYPLITSQSTAQVIPHAVIVGNAAHSLSPVAAQGLNLTLRDLDCLVRHIKAADNPGDLAVLEAYLAERETDQALVARFSGSLSRLFSTRFAPVAHGRQLGLVALSMFPGLRHRFARRAMGLTGDRS